MEQVSTGNEGISVHAPGIQQESNPVGTGIYHRKRIPRNVSAKSDKKNEASGVRQKRESSTTENERDGGIIVTNPFGVCCIEYQERP